MELNPKKIIYSNKYTNEEMVDQIIELEIAMGLIESQLYNLKYLAYLRLAPPSFGKEITLT